MARSGTRIAPVARAASGRATTTSPEEAGRWAGAPSVSTTSRPGAVSTCGDARVAFSIQSVSKLFALTLAYQCVGDALRAVHARDSRALKDHNVEFNASFILGGQIAGAGDFLLARPECSSSKIGVVGFCMGGALTIAAPWLMQVPALHGVLSALGCRPAVG